MTTIEEQNKIIDEGIKEIEEILNRPISPPEPREEKTYEPDPQSVWIDEQIKEIEDGLYNPTPKVPSIDEQKKRNLLTLINDKETVIEFLTKQLEEVKKEKLDLEEKLECLRYTSN